MKKLLLILPFLLLGFLSIAQVPQKMSYQAVVRNASNALVINAPVGMQISILQGSATGTAVYVETQNPTTNDNGLVSLEIGNGIVVSGVFASIDWATGPYFIKTETDPAGGSNYSIVGTSQLLSVPYAMYAETSGNNTSYLPGNGITISNDSIINNAPDQIVNINGTGQTNVSGLYPNFNINTPPYTSGTGISINGQFVNAQNSNPIWNAEKLQGVPIDTITPNLGDILQFDGNKWKQSDKLPQMTTAQREGLTNLFPGMMILNTNTDCIEYYTGVKWLGLCGTEGEVGSSETGGLQQGGQMILDNLMPDSVGLAYFSIGNNIYFLNYFQNQPIKFYAYNAITKQITTKASIPGFSPPNVFFGFSHLTNGYLFTCHNSGNSSTFTMYKYDEILNVWSVLPTSSNSSSFNSTKANYIGALNDNLGFVFADNFDTYYYQYNLLTNSWTETLNPTVNSLTLQVGIKGHWKETSERLFVDGTGAIAKSNISSTVFTFGYASSIFPPASINGTFYWSRIIDYANRHLVLKSSNTATDFIQVYEVFPYGSTFKDLNLNIDPAIGHATWVNYLNGALYFNSFQGVGANKLFRLKL
jgi:hypothetical protein